MSRVTIITLSVLLLVGLVAAVTIGVISYVHNNDNKKPTTSAKAVQEMCQPTDYKEACFKSLSKVNSDDPKELVKAAFESTIAEISEVVNKSVVLKELEKDPKTAEAVKDCKELFQDAINDLQRSYLEIGEFDFNKIDKMLENLKIWLSATITYQETCLDGFDNTTGDAGEKVRKILQTAMQMSSNGLAIVAEMSTLIGTLDISSFNRRRLLADDRQVLGHHQDSNVIPYWLQNRRLLSSAESFVEGHGSSTFLDDMPAWLDGPRRKLLEAANLAEDLKGMANVTVAQDGSGKFKTIEEAINTIPKYGNQSYVIYIKEGVYNEYLVLFKWMTHVVFVGDGPTKTRITNNKNFADGVKTFKTATLSVLGDFFMAKDIGIENSAGAIKHQAVALRVQSDQSIFYNCHMDGYQDTLYTHTYRQFYRDCRVTGTIDFIFGDAAAFFQNCTFVIRKPLENQRCIVTAQGRMERHQPTGIFIHKCRFEADTDYYPIRKKNTGYLGRPWKEYSKTIIMESYIDDSIAPDGWLPWEGNFALETCYYGEYNNVGPGSDMSNRVRWRGIKTIVHRRAEMFMPQQLYGNDDWIRASGVPYDPNLSSVAPAPGSGFGEDPNAPAGAPSNFMSFTYGSSSSGSLSSSSSSSFSSSSSSSTSSRSSTGHSSSASSSGSSGSSSASATQTGGNNQGSTSSSSATTPSTNNQGSTIDGSTGSYTTTPSTSDSSSSTPSKGKSGSAGSGLSSTTTPSSSQGSSTGSGSSSTTNEGSSTGSGSSSITSPSTGESGSTTSGSSSSTTTPSTSEGLSTEGSTQSTSTPVTDVPTQSPVSTEAPAPSPSSTTTPSPSSTISKSTSAPDTTQPTGLSPSSSPSSGSINVEKKVQTGPMTVRELERMLMTNEEMGGEDDTANDDMSGNVPDGDEPSPAMVEPTSPTPTPTPTPTESSSSPSPLSLIPSPGPSPSEEVGDWLPPAATPAPDAEPADKVPPTNAPPPKSNNASSNSKLFKLHVMSSCIVAFFALAM